MNDRRRMCIVRQQNFYELPLRREAEAFLDAGFEVHVLLMAGDEKRGPKTIDGVVLHRLPGRRERGGVLRYAWDYGSFFVAVAALLTWLHIRHPFDVIQVNTMPDLLVFATLLPRLLGSRVTLFVKEPVPELYQTIHGTNRLVPFFAAQEQWAIRFAHQVFTVTDELKARLVERGADGSKITVVLNGPDGSNLLDHRREGCGPDPDHFTFVCNGTIEERYGHDILLEATRIAIDSNPNIRVRITGDGTAEPKLEQRVTELGLADHVIVLGWLSLPDLVCELDGADAGVIPMKSSPYSDLIHTNKMYDYTLFGKPIIASRLRSVDAYFDDGSICFFEPGSPESLADAMLTLSSDPALCESLAAKASSLLEVEYGWDHQKATLVDTTLGLINS